ncbi:uncharacterized protein CPUR_03266 [Claviceps purpurea 20.1]|uniref:HAT C-terminal dimerisation domain-containing protein n=1 Tax=Claviceps purpurea (strain 20.1) TaxID=1111077 RepID=M1VZU0_CLAP2|nr:uncharacterized protein CPUR_03266 [Claviceps purpurea 20.1]
MASILVDRLSVCNLDSSSSQTSLSSPAINKDWDTVPQTIRNSWAPSDRPGRCTGWFWAHGHDVQRKTKDGQGYQTYFLCCHCIAQQVYDPKSYVSSNTRNIENHLRKAHNILPPDPSSSTMQPLPKRDLDQPDLHSFLAKKQKTNDVQTVSVAPIDKPTFERHLVQLATNLNLSFDLFEDRKFLDILNYLNPSVKEGQVTHDSLRNTILEEADTFKAHVIDALERSPSRVHISFEGWTPESEERRFFFSINAFFLDAETFKPQKIMLGVPDLTTFDTGAMFSGAVMEVLEEFNLMSHHSNHNNKVGCLLLNDAPDSDEIIENLGEMLQWQHPSQRRIFCFGHVLHHVSRTTLFGDNSEAVDDLHPDNFYGWAKRGPVGKLHNLLAWITLSNKATSIVKSLQAQDSQFFGGRDVLLDDKPSWLPQWPMIECAIRFRPYLEELIEIMIQASTRSRSNSAQQTQTPPLPACLTGENLLTDADWKALDWIKDILATFNSCHMEVEEGASPVKSEEEDGITEIKRFGDIWKVVPAYERLRERLEQARVEVVVRPELSYYASHINAAWTVANKYFAKLDETPLLYAATVLHPGIQWDLLTSINAAREDRLAEARQRITTLWEEEYRDLPIQWNMDSGKPQEHDLSDPYSEWPGSNPAGKRVVLISDELERWWSTAGHLTETEHSIDPFEYWSEMRFDYPRVAKMALDILSIPAIASDCERSIPSTGSLASLHWAELDITTNAISRAVKSWDKAGLLEGYDGLLKEL